MIVMVIIRVKIVYINVLMRLVSRSGGSLNSSWLPPSSSTRESKILNGIEDSVDDR